MATKRATKATESGRAYLALQAQARRDRRSTDELLQLYALEGFLDRLAGSQYVSRLILKGGLLLAAYEIRRPTRDIDLQAQDQTNEDVGDPIWPAPRMIALPRLLGGSVEISGYPPAMIFAEKIVTAIQRSKNNTRWRDFADVFLLSASHTINGDELHRAITEVAAFRKVELVPLAKLLDGFAETGQTRWVAWRTKQRLSDRLPEEFDTVLKTIAVFGDPAITGSVRGRMWNPMECAWR